MRSFRLLGMMLVAMFALLAVLSTVALADETPLVLPFEAGQALTGTNVGKPQFINPNGTVICESASALETNIESNLPPLGKFHIHFKGCKDKTTGATCTGLGEELGIILVLGTWHLVWDEKSPTFELHVATLFLIETVHFNCTALVLLEVKGEQLCLDLEPEVSKTTHEFHCFQKEGKQEDQWCKKDLSAECMELVTPILLTSVNHGTAKESAEEALGTFTYPVAVATHSL